MFFENVVFMNNILNQVIDGISILVGNIIVKQNVLKLFSWGIWVIGGNVFIEGNMFIFNVFQGVVEFYVVFVINDVKVVIKGNFFKSYKNYFIFSLIFLGIFVIGNCFELLLFIVIVYLNLGMYEVIDNIIMIN